MREINCKQCDGKVEIGDKNCPNCGIPLPPNLGKYPQKNFILFFIALIIFCIFMIIWLPPNWTQFMGNK